MARHMASFEVSAQVLIEALGMPKDTDIYAIARHDFVPDVFVFVVEHPDLPELPEGARAVRITPTVTDDPVTGRVWDWNVAKPAQDTGQ